MYFLRKILITGRNKEIGYAILEELLKEKSNDLILRNE
jgi:NAD(P)-dependent dehydrogenase (short-subunit alcohol dehydrogenase family)